MTRQMYELRDREGQPVTKRAAKELIASHYTVTPKQRTRSRSHTIEAKRARLKRQLPLPPIPFGDRPQVPQALGRRLPARGASRPRQWSLPGRDSTICHRQNTRTGALTLTAVQSQKRLDKR